MKIKLIYACLILMVTISAILSANMYPYIFLNAERSSKDVLFNILTSSHFPQSSYYVMDRMLDRVSKDGEKERLLKVAISFASRGVDPSGIIEILGKTLPNIADPIERGKVSRWASDYTFRVSMALTGKGMDPRQALSALGELIPRLVSPRERSYVMNLGMSMARKGFYPSGALKSLGNLLPMLSGNSERGLILSIGVNLAKEGIDPTGVLEAFRVVLPALATTEQRIKYAEEAAGYAIKMSRVLRDNGVDPEYAVRILGRILPGIVSPQERILLTQELVAYFINVPSELSKRRNAMKALAGILSEVKTSEERGQIISLAVLLSDKKIDPAPALNALLGVLRHCQDKADRDNVIRLGFALAETGVNPANTFDAIFMEMESDHNTEYKELLEMCLSIAVKGFDPADQVRSISRARK